MKCKYFIKFTSILITASFLSSSTLGYAREEFGGVAPIREDREAAISINNTVNVPASLGRVKRSFSGKEGDGPSLIHIQDAHCVYPCQERINSILERVEKDRGIRRIFLEGGSGAYDLTIFRQIPDRELRRKVTDVFLEEGIINAAEYFAANSAREIEVTGVEDKDLYIKNLGVFRNANNSIAAELGSLEKFNGVIKKIAAGVFSDKLVEFYRYYLGYKLDKIGLAEYIIYLRRALAPFPGRKTPGEGNIDRLVKLFSMEEAIDFKKAEKERANLMDLLFKTLPNSMKETLVNEMIEYKKGGLSDLEFNESVWGLFGKTAIKSGAEYEELAKYLEYLREWSGVDSLKLMSEIPLMESELKSLIPSSASEKAIIGIWDRVDKVEKILGYKLTSTEYSDIRSDPDKYTFGAILADMKKVFGPEFSGDIGSLDLELKKNDPEDRFIKDIFEFYEFSFERDDVFVSKISAGRSGGEGQGGGADVFMTGGFHTDNICGLFEKKGVSYVSIIPKFDNEEGSSERYFGILAGTRTGLVGNINAAMSNLQVPSLLDAALGEEVWGKGGIERMEAAVYVQTLAFKGYRVEIYDKGTGETVFSYGRGVILLRCSKEDFPRAVHERFMAETQGHGSEGKAEVPDDADVDEANVRKILDERKYLEDEELSSIVEDIIMLHEQFDRELEGTRKGSNDPARYKISIREIKRFSDNFKQLFQALLNGGKTRKEAIKEAKIQALKNIYADMSDVGQKDRGFGRIMFEEICRNTSYPWPQPGADGIVPGQQIQEWMERMMREAAGGIREAQEIARDIKEFLDGNENNIFDQTYAKLVRAIEGGIPSLFIKEKDTLGALERAIKKYSEKPGVKVEKMECTPYSDSAQLIGGFMPKGRVDVKKAYENVGEAIAGKGKLSVVEILAELLDKTKDEVTEKEIQDFTDIFNDGQNADEGLIIAAAMIIEDSKTWRNKLNYENGLLARIVKQCNEDKGTTYIFNIQDIEALPARIRAQLNAFLLTGELRVPGAPKEEDRKLIAPKNLRIIASMSEEAVLEDGAFYDRFLRKKVASADGNDIKALIKMDHPKINDAVIEFLLKVKEQFNKADISCAYVDLVNIATYTAKSWEKLEGARDQLDVCEYEARIYFESSLKTRAERVKIKFKLMETGKFKGAPVMSPAPAAPLAPSAPSAPSPMPVPAPSVLPGNVPPSQFSPIVAGDEQKKKMFRISVFIMYVRNVTGSNITISELMGYLINNADVIKTRFGEELHNEVVAFLAEAVGRLGDISIDQFPADQAGVKIGTHFASPLNKKILDARYDSAERRVFFDNDGPGLKINKNIAGRLDKYMAGKKLSLGVLEFTSGQEDEIITAFFLDELDYFIDTDEKRMLSSVARSMEYGNGVIRIEGATGAGKTYTAEVLSRIMDFGDEIRPRFYAEPVNKETKLARFLGYFRADKYGYYSIDQTTPFLDIIKHGGVAAISEINTAVKDEYSKLAWWFIQFARGDKEIFLNEYPRKGDDGAISPSVRRHPKSLIIFDVNPEDFEGRGKFPRELIENTPSVYVEQKMNDVGHIKKVTRAFLKHLEDGGTKDQLVEFISQAHIAVFDKIKVANENGDRYPPLSYRELARVTRSILAGLAMNESLVMAEKAVNKYYIKAFVSEQIKSDLKTELDLWSATEERDEIIKDVLFGRPEGRSPPVLVASSSDEDPFGDIDSAVNKFKEENPDKKLYRERVRITWFDDEFKLFGGFLPISLREKASTASARLKTLLADGETRAKANGIYREIRKESGQPEQDLPEDISGLDDGYILSLSEALDPLNSKQEWRQALRYENGIIPRLIDEASKEKEKNGDKAKIFIIELENIHRIKPGLAVAFNTILQEGYYYDPVDKVRKQVPDNLKFVATSITEAALPFSVAEESRWVRLKQSERVLDMTASDAELMLKGCAVSIGNKVRKGMGIDIVTPGLAVNKYSNEICEFLEPFLRRNAVSSKEAKLFIADIFREIYSRAKDGEIDMDNAGLLELMKRTFFLSAMMSWRGHPAEDEEKAAARKYYDETLKERTPSVEDLLEEIPELVRVEAATFQAFNSGRIVLYEGPPGGGKTDMAIDVARRLGLKDYLFSCHNRVHTSELLGTFSQHENGDFYYTGVPVRDNKGELHYPEADFLEAMTHGGVYIFDEGAIGKRSQELLSVLSGLARGEKLFMLNEVPGYPPKELKVHKDFHIIITMNPPEDTVGREPLPLELYDKARKIWIDNGLTKESYRRIIGKFVKVHAAKYGITPGGIFGSGSDDAMASFADALTVIHKKMNEIIGTKISLAENIDLHLLTLRDMKALVKDFVEYVSRGIDKTEALRIAVRTSYIDQFNELRDRPVIEDEMTRLFKTAEYTDLIKDLAGRGIDLEKLIKGLMSADLDKNYLDDEAEEEKGDFRAGSQAPLGPSPGKPFTKPVMPLGIKERDINKPYVWAAGEKVEPEDRPLWDKRTFLMIKMGLLLRFPVWILRTIWDWTIGWILEWSDKVIYVLKEVINKIRTEKISEWGTWDSVGYYRTFLQGTLRKGLAFIRETELRDSDLKTSKPRIYSEGKTRDAYLYDSRDPDNPYARAGIRGVRHIPDKNSIASLTIGGREHIAFVSKDEPNQITVIDMSTSGGKTPVRHIVAGKSAIGFIKTVRTGDRQYLAVAADEARGGSQLIDLSREGKESVIHLDLGARDIVGIDREGERKIAVISGSVFSGKSNIRVIDLGRRTQKIFSVTGDFKVAGKMTYLKGSKKEKDRLAITDGGMKGRLYYYGLNT
ncbi:MAG: AAA family ATPase, partial [Candidatus Omnitrophica bacterium]|nr:AAA family ATPase [Candidatus Omnitrophota bacterium]